MRPIFHTSTAQRSRVREKHGAAERKTFRSYIFARYSCEFFAYYLTHWRQGELTTPLRQQNCKYGAKRLPRNQSTETGYCHHRPDPSQSVGPLRRVKPPPYILVRLSQQPRHDAISRSDGTSSMDRQPTHSSLHNSRHWAIQPVSGALAFTLCCYWTKRAEPDPSPRPIHPAETNPGVARSYRGSRER